MSAHKTPVMQQHAAAKRAYPDAIVLFRLGDFYEMFGDDAILCAKVLDLTLTSRNKGKPDEIPMAGVPHHAAHSYIGRLLRAGYKLALCEQMADPALTKGIVPREVVRILTPGTVTHSEHLESTTNNWLAAIEIATDEVGIATLDLSTGELGAASLPNLTALLAELCSLGPREVLLGTLATQPAAVVDEAIAPISAMLPSAAVRSDEPLLETDADVLGVLAEEAKLLPKAARDAVIRVLRFAQRCNPGKALPLRRIARWESKAVMVLDPTAQLHLELVQSMSGDKHATLLGVIDLTETALGARLLRRRLLTPLLDVNRIRRRLDQVELFIIHSALRQQLRTILGKVSDLERLSIRAALGEATPRDLGALRDGLIAAQAAVDLLAGLEEPEARETLELGSGIDTVTDVASKLDAALVDRPPAQVKEGAVFKPGYDPELHELDNLRSAGTERIVALEAELREKSEIPSLKARYTRVFGWYLEVSKSQLSRVPSNWRRKQTIAGGERYTLDVLDELAERIAGAEELHRARELGLLKELLQLVRENSSRIGALAEHVAAWDCAAALAEVAHRHDYSRPHVDAGNLLEIEEGRHPVVERLRTGNGFIANDVALDLDAERLWIVTGPNMAGKSTLLRQTALITLLAQMGSYVPARRAKIGLVDRILSRVGASDNLARGESTFMVEMRETAEILRHSSRRSLVILDEIGRGTSTFDGLAIAWAVAEYLDEVVGCRALFATHYHELTALADKSPQVANYSVSAREIGGDIVFLHRLLKGPASRSYGVAVAKLAGLPESVLARAQAILKTLEGNGSPRLEGKALARGTSSNQLGLFEAPLALDKEQQEVLDTLRALDPDRLTPLEALQLLSQLKRKSTPSK